MLSDDKVASIIVAYAMVEQHGETMMLLGARPERLPSGRVMYLLPNDKALEAADASEHIAKDVQKAIDLL